MINLKRYAIFIIIPLTILSYATEQTLSLSAFITDEYIVIGANGNFSPKFYYITEQAPDGIHYKSLKKNADVFDEVVEYLKLIRQRITKPDSNDITLIIEPGDDALAFSQRMQSYEPLILKLKKTGFTNISITSPTGKLLQSKQKIPCEFKARRCGLASEAR